MDDNFHSIMGVVYAVGALLFAYRAWVNGRLYSDTKGPQKPFQKILLEEKDIPPLPAALTQLDRQLSEFGFELKYAELIRQKANTPEYTSFTYLARDGHTIAQMILFGTLPFVAFLTRFRDDAALVTTYPRGENIQTPQFTARRAAFSMDTAWKFHGQMIGTWAAQKGSPVRSQTVEQMEAVDQWYSQAHQGKMNRRWSKVFLLMTVLSTGAALFLALLAVNTFTGGPLTGFDISAFGVLFIPLLGIFLREWLLSPRGAIDEGMSPPAPEVSPALMQTSRPEAEPLISSEPRSLRRSVNRPAQPAASPQDLNPTQRPLRLTQLLWFMPIVLVVVFLGVSVANPGISAALIGNAKIQVRTPDGWSSLPIPGDIARGLASTPDGTVWALTANNLYRWVDRDANWQAVYSTSDNIVEMAVDGALIWLVSNKAVVRCGSVPLQCETAQAFEKGMAIDAIDDQVLALSANGMALHYDGANWQSFNIASELPGFIRNRTQEYLANVAITADGTLWIEWGQLWRRPLGSQEWILATYEQQAPVNVEILGAAGNYLWTLWSNGISEDEPDLSWWTFFYWDEVGGSYYNRIFDMADTRDGSVWFGVEDGLLHYNSGRFELVSLPENERVLEVLVMPDGRIWTQTAGTGAGGWLGMFAVLGIIFLLNYSMRRATRGMM